MKVYRDTLYYLCNSSVNLNSFQKKIKKHFFLLREERLANNSFAPQFSAEVLRTF